MTARQWKLPRYLDFCICYSVAFFLSWYLMIYALVYSSRSRILFVCKRGSMIEKREAEKVGDAESPPSDEPPTEEEKQNV